MEAEQIFKELMKSNELQGRSQQRILHWQL